MSAETRDGAGAAAGAAREIRATRDAAGLFDYSARGKVVVSGGDRIEFLQGMLTSDVAALAAVGAQRSAIVTAMGKMIANLLLLKRGDDVLLETPPGRAPVVVETLAKYIITEDVEAVDRTSDLAILSVQGPRSAAVLRDALVESTSAELSRVDKERDHGPAGTGGAIPEAAFAFGELAWRGVPLVILRHDRFRLPGHDVWAPVPHAAALREAILRAGAAHGLVVCGDDARETLRIAAGRPAWDREITEDNFPGEVGLSSAVSVTKGCYIGQEVLSRIHHVGHVNRILVRAHVAHDAKIPIGAPVIDADKRVGQITSLAPIADGERRSALAIVRRESAGAGATLEVTGDAGASRAELVLVDMIA
jgi:folate-binding protein YgfZ